MYQGDHKRGLRGLPVSIGGSDELIQRAMIRLAVRRGSFAPDPELGSAFYTLGAVGARDLDAAALSLAHQALMPLAGVSVTGASCSRTGDQLRVNVALTVGNETKTLEVNLGI